MSKVNRNFKAGVFTHLFGIRTERVRTGQSRRESHKRMHRTGDIDRISKK